MTCKFVAVKTKIQCREDAFYNGYCKTHKSSLQAKREEQEVSKQRSRSRLSEQTEQPEQFEEQTKIEEQSKIRENSRSRSRSVISQSSQPKKKKEKVLSSSSESDEDKNPIIEKKSKSFSESKIGKKPTQGRSKTPIRSQTPKRTTKKSQRVSSDRNEIIVRKNKFGNYEDSHTSFLFDPNTHLVYGKQNYNGKVLPLTLEDKKYCKENRIDYKKDDFSEKSESNLSLGGEENFYDEDESEQDESEQEQENDQEEQSNNDGESESEEDESEEESLDESLAESSDGYSSDGRY